ncbi:MAG: hypothetical protein KGH98_01950 [Candidatus Micrarchaeota archaeon]|nr:hypothetical protein [Candidatus Micrarchaeota archaeon]
MRLFGPIGKAISSMRDGMRASSVNGLTEQINQFDTELGAASSPPGGGSLEENLTMEIIRIYKSTYQKELKRLSEIREAIERDKHTLSVVGFQVAGESDMRTLSRINTQYKMNADMMDLKKQERIVSDKGRIMEMAVSELSRNLSRLGKKIEYLATKNTTMLHNEKDVSRRDQLNRNKIKISEMIYIHRSLSNSLMKAAERARELVGEQRIART